MTIEKALAGLLAGIESREDQARARDNAAKALGRLFMLTGEGSEAEEFFLRLAIKLEGEQDNA